MTKGEILCWWCANQWPGCHIIEAYCPHNSGSGCIFASLHLEKETDKNHMPARLARRMAFGNEHLKTTSSSRQASGKSMSYSKLASRIKNRPVMFTVYWALLHIYFYYCTSVRMSFNVANVVKGQLERRLVTQYFVRGTHRGNPARQRRGSAPLRP